MYVLGLCGLSEHFARSKLKPVWQQATWDESEIEALSPAATTCLVLLPSRESVWIIVAKQGPEANFKVF